MFRICWIPCDDSTWATLNGTLLALDVVTYFNFFGKLKRFFGFVLTFNTASVLRERCNRNYAYGQFYPMSTCWKLTRPYLYLNPIQMIDACERVFGIARHFHFAYDQLYLGPYLLPISGQTLPITLEQMRASAYTAHSIHVTIQSIESDKINASIRNVSWTLKRNRAFSLKLKFVRCSAPTRTFNSNWKQNNKKTKESDAVYTTVHPFIAVFILSIHIFSYLYLTVAFRIVIDGRINGCRGTHEFAGSSTLRADACVCLCLGLHGIEQFEFPQLQWNYSNQLAKYFICTSI